MTSKKLSIPIAIAVTLAISAQAAFTNDAGPARWDQQEAIRRVQQVTDCEQRGDFGWQKIAWIHDPAEAAAMAQRERKPILVFLYLRKDAGPKEAPC